MCFTPSSATARRANRHSLAFTLIELLVVIAIIGLLMAVGIPAFKGFGKSNAIAAADRQLLDDLAFARQRAIADHTDVYMLFVWPGMTNLLNNPALSVSEQQALTNVLSKQFSGYALYAKREVGNQPGQKSPRYLTSWRALPEGIFIAEWKFYNTLPADGVSPFQVDSTFNFPLATSTNALPLIPFLKFNYLGQLAAEGALTAARDSGAEVIPLSRGSVFYKTNNVLIEPFDPSHFVLEVPPGNSRTNSSMWHHLRIDALTGRARVEQQELQ